MKRKIILVLLILFPQKAFMSGKQEVISLEESCSSRHSIYVITITGSISGVIKELSELGPEISNKIIWKAKIDKVIYKDSSFLTCSSSERWQIIFPESEINLAKKIKSKKENYPQENDDIYIMKYEDLHYSIMYYRDNLHKIFIYHRCKDSAQKIKTGEQYIFIKNNESSMKNGILYGNVDLGIFPYTKEMKNRVDKIIDTWK